QTSDLGYGQIYVGAVNWLLMIVTVGLAVLFKKSDNLAAAYGIAVSLTMLMTTALLFVAMREIWNWNLALSAAVACVFLPVGGGFFLANSLKIAEGGYVPLVLAGAVYGLMLIWHRGSEAVARYLRERPMTVEQFLADVAARKIARVP